MEKVINALEECTTSEDCINCSYHEFHGRGCFQKLMKDAMTLLKREPVEPIRGEDMDTSSACWWYVCPSCRIAIDYQDRFCRHCGQPLKWK